jgi:DNA adenine methylase
VTTKFRLPNTVEISSRRLTIFSNSGTPLADKPLAVPATKPPFKWAGGKRWLAPAAPILVPAKWKGRYFEPFVGSGAFFFALGPAKATLSDRNCEVIATYQALKLDPDSIIEELNFFPHDPDFYYYLRGTRPRSQRQIATRFLYLNRTCWNGLYRVNKDGEFNTPFGDYSHPTICDEYRIEDAADALAQAKLRAGDFETVLKTAQRGDFAYCDPPYITGHTNNGFHKYNASLFSWCDQQRLARIAIQLKAKGVHVLVSNADHESVVQLYKGFKYYKLKRCSLIAAEPGNRGVITEALLASYTILGCESEVIR